MARTAKQPQKRQAPKKNAQPQKNQNLFGEVVGILLIALGILLAVFLYFSDDALVAEWSRVFVFGMFGALGYLVPLLVAGLGILFIVNIDIKNKNTILVCCTFWVILAFVELCSSRIYAASAVGFFPYLGQSFTNGRGFSGGGILGGILAYPVELLLGQVGGLILFGAVLLALIMIITHFSIRDAASALGGRIREASVSAAAARKERSEKQVYSIKEKAKDVDEIYDEAFETPEEELYTKKEALRKERMQEATRKKQERERQEQRKKEAQEAEREEKRRKDIQAKCRGNIEQEVTDLNLLHKDFGSDKAFPATESGYKKKIEMYPSEGALDGEFKRPKLKPRRGPKGSRVNHLIVPPKVTDPLQQQLAEQYYDDTASMAEEPVAEKPVVLEEMQKGISRKVPAAEVPEYPLYDEQEQDTVPQQMPEAEEMPEEDPGEPPAEKAPEKVYLLPTRLDLLEDSPKTDNSDRMKRENLSKALMLEQALKSFNIDIKVNNIVTGPSVTRYELLPAPGVKVSRILNLANDIALNLAASSVRIEAPIPGKSAIGIEVPNDEVATVKIKELLEAEEFRAHKSKLYFALGKDITGKYIYGDLTKMPHLLVAGTTGSGKSVCINSIILSILYRSSPEEVNFLMVDPKVVEMKRFNGIPHMKTAVVTDPKKATSMLNWVVNEMLKRYKDFADANVKEIDSFNAMRTEKGEKILPKLVVIIDELADLMMASKHEVEDAICRIAQLGRAAGIHLVVATQTPRAEVVTGMIKTNISSRIALAVSSQVDSRIILDMNGAEDLLGRGDMLFMPIGQSKPVRLQGCFISDEESNRVIEFLQNSPYEVQEDADLEKQLEEGVAANNGAVGSDSETSQPEGFDDELIPKAIELALEYEQLSSSMLMRRLKIGYARAARLVDQLELNEIVSPADGNKPRQILITQEEYRRMFGKEDT